MNKKLREKLNAQKKIDKIPELKGEEKVKFLAKELIKSIEECGLSMIYPSIGNDFAAVSIDIFRYGTAYSEICVSHPVNKWEIRVNELEADSNGGN